MPFPMEDNAYKHAKSLTEGTSMHLTGVTPLQAVLVLGVVF